MGRELVSTAILFGYYLVALLLVPLLIGRCRRVPRELLRKLQHLAYGMSIWLMLVLFDRWYLAILGASLLLAVAYPALALLERWHGYRRNFVDRQRSGGELRRSMLWVQASFALLIALFWGAGGEAGKYVVAAGVMGWTFGDAAAALFGKLVGRHPVDHPLADGRKTHEGSIAMAVVAFLALWLTLLWYAHLPLVVCLAAAACGAAVAATVELFSHDGIDTLTVPIATAAGVFVVVQGLGVLSQL